MLTTDELNQGVLGREWGWDPEDDVLWVRAFPGRYDEAHGREVIASFTVVRGEYDPATGESPVLGYADPEFYVERDVRDTALERIHYAFIPLPVRDEKEVLAWLSQPFRETEREFAAAIAAVLTAPNQVDAPIPARAREGVTAAGEGSVPVPEPVKQHYTVAYRVTGTFTYEVEASSPECAFHAGEVSDWDPMEFECDEIHAITVRFDRPKPGGGWERVHRGEHELDLEEHGAEDELEGVDGQP